MDKLMKKVSPKKESFKKLIVYSEEFKRSRVKEVEEKLSTVSQICREYGMRPQTVYNWIYLYSFYLKKGIKQVIEMESEQEKTRKLLAKVAELERVIGQKQMQIDFLEKMVEIAGNEVGFIQRGLTA